MKTWACLLLLGLAGCSGTPPPPLAHEAYVWQQAWTPALRASLDGPAASGLTGWRVLIAEQQPGGDPAAPRWRTVAPDWAALKHPGRALTAVLRLDAQLAALDEPARSPASAALLRDILERWQAARRDAGQPLDLELDHDCATRRLPGYAGFLRALHAQVHAQGGTLGITALPAWLARPQTLRELLGAVDGHVLQVHAVNRPDRGLWDAAQTEAWLDDWARISPHPFALALPTVGSVVRVSGAGEVLAVQSHAPVAARDWPPDSRELSLLPDPQAMADFLVRLQTRRPAQLQAIAWFRWPLAGEARSLDPDSWALLRRDPAGFAAASRAAPWRWEAEPVDGAADERLRRWVLVNPGPTDLRLPAELPLPTACDTVLPLGSAQLASKGRLRLAAQAADVRLLPAGQRLAVALVRCPSDPHPS